MDSSGLPALHSFWTVLPLELAGAGNYSAEGFLKKLVESIIVADEILIFLSLYCIHVIRIPAFI